MNQKKSNKREIVSDCLMICGSVAVSVGVGLLHVVAGVIVGGVLAMTFGWLVGRGGDAE